MDVRGLVLNQALHSDKVCVKLVYMLDGRLKGFLELSKTTFTLKEILDRQHENMRVEMLVSPKNGLNSNAFERICQFKIVFRHLAPTKYPILMS